MKALSLFSGAGGMDLGVIQAGFEVLASVEIDPHCCDTLRSAVVREGRSTLVIEQDVRAIEPHELMEELALNVGELGLLFGGPPCQSFSLAGKQLGLDDERGMLLFEILRFAQKMRPKVILLEQVKGLLSAKGGRDERGEVFQQFLKKLTDIGYVSKWKILKAADYGVAQLRERLFVVATRDENGFMFPEPTHSDKKNGSDFFGLPNYATVGDLINHLAPPLRKNKTTPANNLLNNHTDVTPARDVERIENVPEGGHLAAQLHLDETIRGSLSKKDTTKYLRLHRNKPSNTLRCGEIFFHPIENRYLTPKEYLLIHGYPATYELSGPIRSRSGTVKNLDQHRQVANSVPPPLAYALANQIRSYLNE